MDEVNPGRTDILAKAHEHSLCPAQVWVGWGGVGHVFCKAREKLELEAPNTVAGELNSRRP